MPIVTNLKYGNGEKTYICNRKKSNEIIAREYGNLFFDIHLKNPHGPTIHHINIFQKWFQIHGDKQIRRKYRRVGETEK
jgi:hypothetical protein